MNQKISHKISGHRDEEILSDFGAGIYSLNIIEIPCFVSITRPILVFYATWKYATLDAAQIVNDIHGISLSLVTAPDSADHQWRPVIVLRLETCTEHRQEGSTKWRCLVTGLRSRSYSSVALDKPFHPSLSYCGIKASSDGGTDMNEWYLLSFESN